MDEEKKTEDLEKFSFIREKIKEKAKGNRLRGAPSQPVFPVHFAQTIA